MNLTNQVHPIVQANAFRNLNALEYAEILPAVKLASRFIDEDEYLDFFAYPLVLWQKIFDLLIEDSRRRATGKKT
jgi:hypothetical protein